MGSSLFVSMKQSGEEINEGDSVFFQEKHCIVVVGLIRHGTISVLESLFRQMFWIDPCA